MARKVLDYSQPEEDGNVIDLHEKKNRRSIKWPTELPINTDEERQL